MKQRRNTISVSADDLSVIADQATKAPQAPTRTADLRLSAVSSAIQSRVSNAPAEREFERLRRNTSLAAPTVVAP